MITATARVANQDSVMLEVAVTMSVKEWDQVLTATNAINAVENKPNVYALNSLRSAIVNALRVVRANATERIEKLE